MKKKNEPLFDNSKLVENNIDVVEDEFIELADNLKLSKDSKKNDKPMLLSNYKVETYAEKLGYGSTENIQTAARNILDNDDFSSNEKVSMMKRFSEKYGFSLLDQLDTVFKNEEDKQAIINAFEKITGSSLLEDISAVYDNKYTQNKMLQKWQLN